MTTKVHAYCRVSTTDQTLEQQQRAVQMAYPQGTEFEWHTDELSGWKGKRPDYELLKKLILRGSVKEVCVVNIARLGRNQREVLQFLELCHDRNVKVKILDTPIDFTGPLGTALFALFAAFAQIDSDTKSMNIRRKLALKKEKDGWQCHGSPPDCVAKKVKERAAEVYEMIDRGRSQKYIAEMLGLSEGTVTKLVRLRGQELLTREEYAQRFPGWHLKPKEEQPRVYKEDPRPASRRS